MCNYGNDCYRGRPYYCEDNYPRRKPCYSDVVNNNNNNNNIVVPPVVVKDCPGHPDHPDHPKKPRKGKLKDFVYDVAIPQKHGPGTIPISNNCDNPTVVADVTVTDIKAGDVVSLSGLFHLANKEDCTAVADVRIFVNDLDYENEIYRALIKIEDDDEDNLAQISVQDVESFASDTGVAKYILTVCIKGNETVKLMHPITFTASLIG